MNKSLRRVEKHNGFLASSLPQGKKETLDRVQKDLCDEVEIEHTHSAGRNHKHALMPSRILQVLTRPCMTVCPSYHVLHRVARLEGVKTLSKS